MSTTSYHRSGSRHWAGKGRDGELPFGLEAIGRSVRELAELAGEVQSAAFRGVLEGLGVRHLPRASIARASACGIPECHCPSPDLGEIRKVTDRREPVRLAFRVRNTTRSRRTFALAVKPVATAAGKAGGKTALSATSVTLDPGEAAAVHIDVDAREHDEGVEYASAINVTSKDCEPMFLRASVLVRRDPEQVPVIDLHCCCTPRPRRQHWYDHYYCDPAQPIRQLGARPDGAYDAPHGAKTPG